MRQKSLPIDSHSFLVICRVLASDDILSTDEGSSSDDDDEFDQLEKNLESLISSKKTATQVSM